MVHKGPIWATRSSQGYHFKIQFTSPLLRKKTVILACTTSIFAQILAFKPQIWKFSVYKTPLLETMISSQAPHFENLGRTPLAFLKKQGRLLGFCHILLWQCYYKGKNKNKKKTKNIKHFKSFDCIQILKIVGLIGHHIVYPIFNDINEARSMNNIRSRESPFSMEWGH